jgi:single-strand selective monofunctional uracil DNA glycosylase
MNSKTTPLIQAAKTLCKECRSLTFNSPVAHVYHPLDYAWEPHQDYLSRYGQERKEVLLVGMNPGPWGMAQTGVPFGEVVLVREWLGIEGAIKKPAEEHPKRPVQGWGCERREVSGLRLWGWARERFGAPEKFFRRFLVMNYCPLCFMEESGRNLTPDKLKAEEKKPLFEACDRHLLKMMGIIQPKLAFGVGKFAADRLKKTCMEEYPDIQYGQILHPSPASPVANRGWAEQAEKQLKDAGVKL